MDSKVWFQRLDNPDRIEGIASLLLRRGRLTPQVVILCPDAGFMVKLDERLWTIHPESFLAHGVAASDAAENAQHPILLALDVCRDNKPGVLINGTCEVPPELDGFSSIVDFVDAWSEPLMQASRERFRSYRQLGLDPQYIAQTEKK
ncbi:MAG: DNA polymerase III subunit chi [Zetaproteobacteria bacterium CG06_land_8_20_14_3_00_59_53]|nr:MAG: DNA polymerase III subunit chi [Zetaproteobacteria bacterium CG2_30_59_37]PIO90919.1 MAG: DNA polymerase III subunit chi [Zetaproteobacteria bacterium CG23_combo_of_CG06-09_8_20_14_all_59_86]PIQ64111.1 MAG: DNA polymerase III subunit chi [Zetaproteobacteria bacterium CG11_big_fil_rev_8_21_14_0_20_59_439]PIU71101.1 MAG: DNA polymerase III subunit chi [Zetaproteobacteria bacterium CG06_land_8_20_14_3_00_59_53]PIU96094.1 MAG: DNA polymerase III subunit chi [Zetaproteobacteria bacterium CG0